MHLITCPPRLSNTLLTSMVALCALACAAEAEAPNPYALSHEAVSVGQPLELLGHDFVSAKKGWVDVTFSGEFRSFETDEVHPVDFTVELAAEDSERVLWPRFGAYRVPFGNGLDTGVFRGEVSATNAKPGEKPTAHTRGVMTLLKVLPSIVMVDARAMGETWVSDCADPMTTAIHFVPYLFRFKAVGFDADDFTYTFGPGIVHAGAVTTDVLQTTLPVEDNEHAVLVQFAPVPDNANGFTTSVIVSAEGDDGQTYTLEVPIVVRRPLQVFFDSGMSMAQLFEPEPVSGCIPGGQGGVEVGYSESHSETRSRTVTHTQVDGWQENYGEAFTDTHMTADTEGKQVTRGTTSSYSDTRSESWQEVNQTSESTTQARQTTGHVTFSSSDTESYDWGIHGEESHSFSKELGLEAGLTGTVEGTLAPSATVLGVGGSLGSLSTSLQTSLKAQGKLGWVDTESGGWTANHGTSSTSGVSRGASVSNSTSNTRGSSHSEAYQTGRAQTYGEANSYATTALQSQTRTYSQAQQRSTTLGKSMSESDAVAETVTSTDTTTLDTRATIPPQMYGVWYRQTTRLIRRGVVVAYDLCGNADVVGDIAIDDWTWAPNLAIGDTCPPEPDLPAAECFVEPCDGQ